MGGILFDWCIVKKQLKNLLRKQKGNGVDHYLFVFLLCRREFLPELIDLGLLDVTDVVPTLVLHLRVDLVLHGQGIIQRGVERAEDILGRGFDRAVQVQVTAALFEQQQVLHQILVIHHDSSLQQRIKAVENLGVTGGQILYACFELRVSQAPGGFLTLLLKILLVSEGVLDIEQLFVGHIITSV